MHTFIDGSLRSGILGDGVCLEVLSQDDLDHVWHTPVGTHSNTFRAEKTALKDVIQWLSTFHDGLQL